MKTTEIEQPTKEGNKLIALFDGMTFHNDDPSTYQEGYFLLEDSEGDATFEPIDLKYSISWDWLMPVIEKISTIKFDEEQGDTHYPRTFGMLNSETGKPMFRFNCGGLFEADTLIEAAWLAVTDYLKTKS